MNTSKLMFSIAFLCSSAIAQDTDRMSPELFGPGEVAVVNGKRIPESLFRLYALSITQSSPDSLDEQTRSRLLEQLIYLRIFADEAERLGLDKERRIAAELELQRMQMLTQYLTERHAEENPPTAARIREIYDANIERLSSTQYKTRHIVVGSEATAREVLEKLDDGEDFSELAAEYSTDTTAEDGGDLGWIFASDVPESLATALTETSENSFYASPVSTEFGWHLIFVEEIRSGEPPSMEELRPELINAAESQILSEYADQLRSESQIEEVAQ